LRKKGALATAGALGSTVLLAPGADAATFSVTNLEPSGAGSLDQAVEDANANDGADQITFQAGLTGTITLDSDLDVNEAVEVVGPGANVITVDGDEAFQFHLYGFDSANETVSVSGLTLRNGSSSYGGNFYNGSFLGDSAGEVFLSNVVITGGEATAPSGDGGAVYNDGGDLTITDSTISGNTANDDGGAVYSDEGSVTILRTTFSENTAEGSGGGVFLYNTDGSGGIEATVADSVFTANDASDGAGVYFRSPDGETLIQRTTFAGGEATSNGGGAILSSDEGEEITLESSTFSGNAANSDQSSFGAAGGLWVLDPGGPVAIRNSTFSGNSAFYGGGVDIGNFSYDVPVSISNSTIVGNSAESAAQDGGGIWVYGSDDDSDPATVDSVTLSSSIVAGNTAPEGADLGSSDLDPVHLEVAFSLIGNPTLSGETTIATTGPNLTGLDPQLGPLQSNGGPTQTHAPAFTSPVIEMGIGNGLPADQRGAPRTFDAANLANAVGGDGTDIGAVELLPGGKLAPDQCKGQTENVLFAPGTPIPGTDGNDVIVGTAGADQLDTGKGDDLVCAGAGNDKAKTGGGKDRAFGEAGKDKLSGQGGKDKLSGQGGKDTLKGGGGKDTLKGGGGKDKLRGGPGKDKLRGGPGKDSERQ
jgi:predicted outer membrane repeat protein